MSAVIEHRSAAPRHRPSGCGPPPSERAGRRGRVVALVALVMVGVGVGVIVGRDGSPGWQLVRLLAVALGSVATMWVVARSPRRRARVSATLGPSLLAVPVGIGIGGPHVVAEGLSVLSVAGLSMLGGGLVLFTAAVVGVWRGGARWWCRLPICAATVVVLATLCWTLGQAAAATNVPPSFVASRTPADIGLVYREVEFRATDGVRLSGWYIPSGNGAAVVLVHGAGSTRSDVLDHAGVLARHGYGVLLFDARGHGRSEGRAMDFGWFGDQDLGGAVAFLGRLRDVDGLRIGAVGLSMGGEEVIGAAAAIPEIRAVVAEGATNRVGGDKAWLSDEFGARGALSEVVESLTYRFADLLTSASPPVTLHEAVRTAARPTLLIAGGNIADEASAGRYIESASPDTVDLWIVPETGHTDALATHPAEWERRVIGFLDDTIGPDEGAR